MPTKPAPQPMSLLSRFLPGQGGAEASQITARVAERSMREDLPDTAYLRARSEFYEAMGAPVVQRARLWVLLVLALVLIGVMALTIRSLFPLKTIQTVFVKVDEKRATAEIDRSVGVRPTINAIPRPVLERELNDWIKALWSVNGDYPSLTKEMQEAAYIRTRDRATKEYLEFLKREQIYSRIKHEPGLIRTVEPKTTTFRAEDGVAMIRFSTLERTRALPDAKRREWLMLLQYKLEPQSKAEEVEKNPLGLYLFHFEITEER